VVVADDRVRVLLPVEATVLANLAVDGRMALTTTNFLTLESWQLKGRVVAVEEASPRDRIRYDAFCAGCLEILVPLHQAPAEQIARLLPVGVVACELLVEQVFDQTPGPGAGARVAPETV
jgi:hypothetical protein